MRAGPPTGTAAVLPGVPPSHGRAGDAHRLVGTLCRARRVGYLARADPRAPLAPRPRAYGAAADPSSGAAGHAARVCRPFASGAARVTQGLAAAGARRLPPAAPAVNIEDNLGDVASISGTEALITIGNPAPARALDRV